MAWLTDSRRPSKAAVASLPSGQVREAVLAWYTMAKMSQPREEDAKNQPDAEAADETQATRRLPTWKRALLVTSGVLMLGGLAVQGYSYLRGPDKGPETELKSEAEQKSEVSRLPGAGFLPSEQPRPTDEVSPQPTGEDLPQPTDWKPEDWSPAAFRLGLGFFLGFCIAYALRAFFKICLVSIGLIVLVFVGLQYAGVVAVDWAALQTHYDRVAPWLAEQTAGLRQFITGYLPSSGTAALGLFTGFRRS